MKTAKSKSKNMRATSAKKSPAKKAKNSNDKLPGEYPSQEDIMNQKDKIERVHVDLDNLELSRATSAELLDDDAEKRPLKPTKSDQSKKKSDLTREDYEALGPEDLSLDGGDDEQLKHRRVDFAGSDLDIPGSELDDDAESRGSEDEENNGYSLGGDKD